MTQINDTETINTATSNELDDEPYINVQFPLRGERLHADHGYALHAAITRLLPALHQAGWLGVELISGVPWEKGVIALPQRGGSLRLRLPAVHFKHILPLAGKRLTLDGHTIRLGIPLARPLEPAASVYARIVTIKNHTEAETFLPAAVKKLSELGITATLELPTDGHTRARRIITIHSKRVVGFSVAAHHLSDEDSITLQTHGLGGRRAMGCGIFNPIVSKVEGRSDAD